MPDVRLPDGRIIKNVPEGTTKAQLNARLVKFDSDKGSGKGSGTKQDLPEPQDFATPEAAAQRRAEFGKGVSDIGRGLIKGGKEVISGLLQTGADIAGAAFPESERVQEFRGLLPESIERSRRQFEARTGGSLAGKVGEFIGQAAPFVAALPLGGATLAGRTIAGVAGGAVAGGTGATTQQVTPEQALERRGVQAVTGAAIGGVLPVGLAGAAKIAGGVTRLVRGRDADKILASKINVTDAKTALQEIESGKISVLADVAGDEIKGLTRAIGKQKGGARNIVADALEGRSNAAVSRISDDLSKSVSNVETYFGNLDDIALARSSASRPLYVKAYSEAETINRDNLNKLLQDQRIITALDDAKANLGVRLEAPANSLEALDGAKKSLDDIIGTAVRAGQNQKAASFIKLKNQLLEELDAASPTYREARKIFSDFKSLENAQELGLQFTTKRPEELKQLLSTLSNTEKEAFKIGVRANLQKTVSTTADGADPAKRIFGNSFKREQLEEVFGEGKQFNQFKIRMEEEIRAAETKFKVLGGSRTDINITDDGEFIVAAVDAARKGIIRTALDAIAGAATRRYTGLTAKSAKDLASILVDRNAGIAALEKLIKDAPKAQKNILTDAIRELSVPLGITAAIGAR